MKIAIVVPANCGPTVYIQESVESALVLLSAWALTNCADKHSIFKMVRGKWVPFAGWLNAHGG